jgi:hypothetical protein
MEESRKRREQKRDGRERERINIVEVKGSEKGVCKSEVTEERKE